MVDRIVEQFTGHFRDGKKNGPGKMSFSNGKVQNGLWENDKFVE